MPFEIKQFFQVFQKYQQFLSVLCLMAVHSITLLPLTQTIDHLILKFNLFLSESTVQLNILVPCLEEYWHVQLNVISAHLCIYHVIIS